MSVSFVRQLGAEAGVQLNPLRDNSGVPTFGTADQSFAIAMRATRGRIDRAFAVDRGTFKAKLGPGAPVRDSALNEAYVHVAEALNNGAYQAVVTRLHTDSAAVSWMVCAEDGANPGEYLFSVSAAAPVGAYLLAVKHHECFNDGAVLELRADSKRASGANVANDLITLRLRDADGVLLHEVTGSLNPAAIDDFGESAYLPDVVDRQTDAFDVLVGSDAALGTNPETYGIPTTSDAYGYDAEGAEKWVVSDVLDYFTEGGFAYDADDYIRARDQLAATQHGFGYIASGGSQSTGLLAQMASLAHALNKQFRFDVPGSLGVDAAITWVEQLNFDEAQSAHLLHAFWAPIKTADPSGVNGRGYYGTSALNIAYACARNAQTDARGFARKHYAIAGKDWPVGRSGVEQTVTPTQQQRNALAKARINPVIFETYSDGGLYVFVDSLTMAPVTNSLKKLISVADMSTSVDDFVTRAANDLLQSPMNVVLRRLPDVLKTLFEGAHAAGWLEAAQSPDMGGAPWRFDVQPNAAAPHERVDVTYWLRYTGTNRQTVVTQTLTR